VEVGVDHIFSFSESQRIFDKIDAVDCQCGIENLLWKALGSDKITRDEIASTIVVGRAYVKHRFSHTDSITANGSHESADFRSLRQREHG